MSVYDDPNPNTANILTPAQMKLGYDEALARVPEVLSPLEALFYGNSDRVVTKWPHYLPIYEQLFSRFRGRPVRMLEIGVQFGGSLGLWRRYFGPDAVLFGIDIDPECANRVKAPEQVRIGSQADPAFLRDVVAEMGGLDIVLDDGSHIASHQRMSFETLWPLLAEGGVYAIEDMHSSYWPKWEGGFRTPGTAIELVKGLIDDMHGWFHGKPHQWAPREEVGSILVGDSIAGIAKVRRPPPGYVAMGRVSD
jgi:hypothetical protein